MLLCSFSIVSVSVTVNICNNILAIDPTAGNSAAIGTVVVFAEVKKSTVTVQSTEILA